MPERFSEAERSRVMRAVQSSNTKPELRLLAILRDTPAAFRSQAHDLPGRPDFVCDELKLVVFLDGDFWHGRFWSETGTAPVAHRDYWIAKFERNIERDRLQTRQLRAGGWSVLRLWESTLRASPLQVRALLRERIARRTREARRRREPAGTADRLSAIRGNCPASQPASDATAGSIPGDP